jgi:outer membrane PBP1 activator LpoA protein
LPVLSVVLLAWLVLTLQGCGISSPRYEAPDASPLSSEQIGLLLQEARTANSPERDRLLLQAVESITQYNQQHLNPQALGLLFEIDSSQLTLPQLARYTTLFAEWTIQGKQMELSQQLLDNDRLVHSLPELDPVLAIPLHRQRIEFFLQNGQALRAIDEYMALGSLLLRPEEQRQNQNALWNVLQQLSSEDRQQLQASGDKSIRSWLELLEIATAPELDLDEQIRQLNAWLSRNPRHPAAQSLPEELRLLQDAQRDRPQHIALLIPLSGPLQKAGEAIRDGFLAAYYQSLTRGHTGLTIEIIDSYPPEDFLSRYEQVTQRADLVIGPLAKQAVALLKQRKILPVSTLALNTPIEEFSLQPDVTENLYLFGLNPEDEARQVAIRARSDHHRKAVVLVPDSDWGERVQNAFITTWLQPTESGDSNTVYQEEPALVLATGRFDLHSENYAEVIQQLLGIQDSKNRYGELRWWSSEDIEFQPRRRQDIDMIFLAARPDQARQIKPLLSFHYAGDIPVYASSSIYSGEALPEKDNDLNGIQLLISPWTLNQPALQQAIQHLLEAPANLQSLYAMGADSWRLSERLTLLAGNHHNRLYGHSGILQINDAQQITRQLLWARIDHGRITALPGSLE